MPVYRLFSTRARDQQIGHGFSSAFQSLGINHPKWNPIIHYGGIVFAIVIAAGFGFFVDATPGDDIEFQTATGQAIADDAQHRVDLLTVIAHELGHVLNLPHLQESDDNLMRSKTFGWQLSDQEIRIAREAAADIAFEDTSMPNCGPPRINPLLDQP